MIFRVPDDFKGTFVLNSISKVLWAKAQVTIEGNDLYAPDVKSAIRKKVLVPIIEGEYDGLEGMGHKVLIVNKTPKTIVLGNITLRPYRSLPVDRDFAESNLVINAQQRELISIVSNDDVVIDTKKNKTDKKNRDNISISQTDEEEDDNDKEDTKENKSKEIKTDNTVAKIWDFQKQASIDVEMNKQSTEPRIIKEENKGEIKPKRKYTKNKKSKKKSSLKKKIKEKTTGKKKVKVVKPVGQVKETEDIAIPLDSRGNPIGEEKPSEVVKKIVDGIGFVDKEQEQERIEKRQQQNEVPDDWDWENL